MKNFESKKSPALWAAFHLAIFFAIAICFFCGRRFSVNTNLFDILPENSFSKIASKADRVLSDKTGRQFFVLSQAEDFDDAKAAAQMLCDFLKNDEAFFESVLLGASEKDLKELFDFYYRNRFLLLDQKTIATLNATGGPQEIAQAALEKAFSGFSAMPMERIPGDPFFLTEIAIENLIANISQSGTSMSLNDGVLSAEYEGNFFVMIRGTLTKSGSSIASKKNGVQKIYDCSQKVLSQMPNAAFVYSGVPFHSHKSAASAQNEIAIISTISVLAIILLFIAIFKTPFPILCSALAIALSILTALCSVLLAFGQIHILCFVFGTTLIGTCLDYSVHFFVRWKGDANLQSGLAIKNKLQKGLFLSFASTEVCYLILLFAPFLLLKQIAIFSFAGIASTFLTVILLYPKFPLPKNAERKIAIFFHRAIFTEKSKTTKRENFFTNKFRRLCDSNFARNKKFLPLILIAILIFIAIFYRKNLRIENDIKSFYTMSGKILEDEILAAKVLNHGSSPWYFIVRGSSQEELLQNEKNFCQKLDAQIANGNLASYTACSQFVPTILSQAESLKASEKLLGLSQSQKNDSQNFVLSQLLNFGFSDEESQSALSQIFLEYENSKNDFVQIQSQKNPLPAFMQNALSSLWAGQIEGEWFCAVMPLRAKNAEIFLQLTEDDENVFFVNKVFDTSRELNRLTKIMLALLLAAAAILLLCLNFFYPAKIVLKIAAVLLAIIFAEAAVLAAANIPIGFFSVVGIILVFGLGLDYTIYTAESGEKLNSLAIFVSFATTELSFALLALSSFVPVKMFGIAVAAGLLAAWISARGFEKKSK